jgi:hypothetical protein
MTAIMAPWTVTTATEASELAAASVATVTRHMSAAYISRVTLRRYRRLG